MVLHVSFADNSNPWVSLPANRQTIAKHWRRWVKSHPLYTCTPSAWVGHYRVTVHGGSGSLYPVTYVVSVGYGSDRRELGRYKHLGHALRWLEYYANKEV